MDKFRDFNMSLRMRDAIASIAEGVVRKLHPPPRYATVIAIDVDNRTVTCEFPEEDGVTFTVPCSTVMPLSTGSTVRISGPKGARYVDEVLDGQIYLQNLRIGNSTEYVDVRSTQNSKLELVENNATGRPYISFWNQDSAGNLDRKGYIGYPESASDNSKLYVNSDQGVVRIESVEIEGGAITGVTSLNDGTPWTSVNDGSGSGLDADKLDGMEPQTSGSAPGANQILRSASNGYTYVGWLNTVSGATTSIDRIYASSDQFVRYVTPDTFRSVVSADIKPCDNTRVYDGTASGTIGIDLDATVGGVSTSGATGAFMSITAIDPSTSGYATVFRYSLASAPTGANVNWAASNGNNNGFAFVELDSSGRFKVYRNSSVRLVIDVQGFIFG